MCIYANPSLHLNPWLKAPSGAASADRWVCPPPEVHMSEISLILVLSQPDFLERQVEGALGDQPGTAKPRRGFRAWLRRLA